MGLFLMFHLVYICFFLFKLASHKKIEKKAHQEYSENTYSNKILPKRLNACKQSDFDELRSTSVLDTNKSLV